MGNQYIDAVWVIPIVAIVALLWLAFHLGVEVGRDEVRREIRAARKRVATVAHQHPNFRVIDGGAGQTPRQTVGVNNNNKEGDSVG